MRPVASPEAAEWTASFDPDPDPSPVVDRAPVIGPEATLPQLESDDFVECYQAHYPRLVRALVLSGAPVTVAEDLAQEAFARMLTHWHRVRAGSSPAGYAYRSAFRLLLRGRRARGAGGQALVEGGPSVAGPEAAVTLRVSAAAALAAMPARRRACAVMCLVVGLSTRDAASALGIAEGTVRKHLAEARNDLRDLLTS